MADRVFLVVFCFGAALRLIDVRMPPHPPSWHEFDSAAIARNYYREGMNLLYPRVDWRGGTPGFAEMEFPLYQWSTAVLYQVFGYHDFLGRTISFALSLVTLWVFIQLASYLLSPVGAVAASLFAAASPLLIQIAHAMQPEGLMLSGYVIAIYTFLRWRNTGRPAYGVAAAAATALAILAKVPAAHVGGLFAGVLLGFVPSGPDNGAPPRFNGPGALRNISSWLFGLCAIVPPALWYWYAHGFWKQYGLSLGVSNEYHFFTRHLSSNLGMIRRIADIELRQVWTPAGVLVALLAVLWNRTSTGVRVGFWWAASVALMYLLIPRTASELWASYYHVPSVLVAAIWFGAGVETVAFLIRRNRVPAMAISGLTLALLLWVPGVAVGPRFHSAVLISVAAGAGTAMLLWLMWYGSRGMATPSNAALALASPLLQLAIAGVAVAAITATFFTYSRGVLRDLGDHIQPRQAACAQRLARILPPNTLILASGIESADAQGYSIAINSPFVFYWADRKGFSIARDRESLDEVLSFARRGAKYFVFEKDMTSANFETQLLTRFPIVDECDGLVCFRLGEAEAIR